jgi:hypothetical protein
MMVTAFLFIIFLTILVAISEDDLDPPDFPNTPPLPEGAR